MHKVDWYGNDGHFNPTETVKAADCGVCNAQMNVKRNVLGATSSIEAMAGKSHRHDSFTCPNVKEDWHKRIRQLKINVYAAEVNNAIDYEKKKMIAEKEIIEILEANAVR